MSGNLMRRMDRVERAAKPEGEVRFVFVDKGLPSSVADADCQERELIAEGHQVIRVCWAGRDPDL